MRSTFLRRLPVWVFFFVLGFVLNKPVLDAVQALSYSPLTIFFAYSCSFIFFILLITVSVETIVWHNRKEFILPFLLSFLVAYWLGIVLKDLFAVERPFVLYGFDVLIPEKGYSFPSLHVVAAFSLLPLLWYKNKIMGYLWFGFSLLIAIARVYLQVHFLSDVVAGAFIGYETASFFLSLEERYGIFSRLNKLLLHTLEIRRQLFHTLFGILLVVLIKTYLVTVDTMVLLVILALFLVWLLKKYTFPRWLYRALSFFEREKHLQRFPARGVFFFLVGALIALSFFPENIAVASIMILALGDSVTNIIGRYFGKWRIWYNPKKHWEGTLAGIFFGLIGASFFVPLGTALLGSFMAMLVETWNVTIGKLEIDDNILIPLVAALSMFLVR
jgi:dolichol kinase/membrane-associated phospholipid phosphatase